MVIFGELLNCKKMFYGYKTSIPDKTKIKYINQSNARHACFIAQLQRCHENIYYPCNCFNVRSKSSLNGRMDANQKYKNSAETKVTFCFTYFKRLFSISFYAYV